MIDLKCKITQDEQVKEIQQIEEKLGFGSDFPQPPSGDYLFTLTSKKHNPVYSYDHDNQIWQQVENNTYAEKTETVD